MIRSKKRGRYLILADTSFLLAPYDFKLNIIKELERVVDGNFTLLVPSFCIDEINRLIRKGFIMRQKGRLALELIKKHATVLKTCTKEGESVDDAIVRIAKEMCAIVATGDREIRKKLRKEGIPVIFIRARKKLELDGELY